MHCLHMGEYTEKILLAMLFSKITLLGSTEESSQGWREENTQESKERMRPDQTLIFQGSV